MIAWRILPCFALAIQAWPTNIALVLVDSGSRYTYNLGFAPFHWQLGAREGDGYTGRFLGPFRVTSVRGPNAAGGARG